MPLDYIDLAECGLQHVPKGLPNTLAYVIVSRNNIQSLRHRNLAPLYKLNFFIADDNKISVVC